MENVYDIINFVILAIVLATSNHIELKEKRFECEQQDGTLVIITDTLADVETICIKNDK